MQTGIPSTQKEMIRKRRWTQKGAKGFSGGLVSAEAGCGVDSAQEKPEDNFNHDFGR